MTTAPSDIQAISPERTMPVSTRRRDHTPAIQTPDVILPIADGLPCTDDMHGAIYLVNNGDAAPQTSGVLDLHRHIVEPVAIEIPEAVHGVQAGRQPELRTQTRHSQRAIRPQGNTAEAGRGALRRSSWRVQHEGYSEQL